ncbi:hypothetical protein [Sphingobium tyrosinilyticum]|uniref:Uncharacterized protein n=1 Tax=Sphingobium tyrosinilyticum TaxID=2715436 RepID=A0ABV9EZC9_9SPHN
MRGMLTLPGDAVPAIVKQMIKAAVVIAMNRLIWIRDQGLKVYLSLVRAILVLDPVGQPAQRHPRYGGERPGHEAQGEHGIVCALFHDTMPSRMTLSVDMAYPAAFIAALLIISLR